MMAADAEEHTPTNAKIDQGQGGGLKVFVRRHRTLVQGLIDALAWSVALCFAILFRYDFDVVDGRYGGLAQLIPLAVLVQGVVGLACGLYTGRSRFGSFEEVMSLAKATAVTAVVLFVLNLIPDPRLGPASVPIMAGVVALMLTAGVRYCWRLAIERRRRPSGDDCQRLLIFGAGEGAEQVIPTLLRDPDSTYLPVGLIDDDPGKRKLRIMGVRVLGNRTRLVEAVKETRADTLLIAMPTAGSELVTELTELGRVAGVAVKVLPPARELFERHVDVSDIRDITAADLLGRHEIHTDVEAIAGYLTGKRVLVTGSGDPSARSSQADLAVSASMGIAPCPRSSGCRCRSERRCGRTVMGHAKADRLLIRPTHGDRVGAGGEGGQVPLRAPGGLGRSVFGHALATATA